MEFSSQNLTKTIYRGYFSLSLLEIYHVFQAET